MASLRFFWIATLLILFSGFTVYNTTSWEIAEEYSIKFSSSKASGSFANFEGVVNFDEHNLSDSNFDLEIDVTSIKTGNFIKNGHAKGKKWFNSAEYPTINYVSKKINKTSDGYEVIGTLDMHGVKKETIIPFTFRNNIFESNFIVNRTDFNIGSTKGLAKKVPHEIKIQISVPVTKLK